MIRQPPRSPLFPYNDALPIWKSYCSRRFGGVTCDDKSAQIYARFDKMSRFVVTGCRFEEGVSRNAGNGFVFRLLLGKKKASMLVLRLPCLYYLFTLHIHICLS